MPDQVAVDRFPCEELNQSVPSRFEKVASVYPDRLAARNGPHELTFAELNRAANRIAHAILDMRGSAPEPVAVLMQRDLPMVAAFVGLLKAGKYYVPVDPALPTERIATILEEVQAGLVVADAAGTATVGRLGVPDERVLRVGQLGEGAPDSNPGIITHADTPAWILYTSGSTGKPEGVITDHRAVLHWAMRIAHLVGTTPEDRFAHVMSFSFSAGMHELVCALLLGASVHLFALKEKGAAELADWLRSADITQLMIVPTVFRQLMAVTSETDGFPELRVVRIGGEALQRTDVEAFQRRFGPDAMMVNCLAGTEIGVVRAFVVTRETRIDGNAAPLGYPVEDVEVLLLDEDGRETPAGEVGEICVQSRYLSRGYWRKPDLTAAAFRACGPGDPRRVYHSG
ncbi:MAG: amino acid adenylation domain-containing protein, partial [bacterium]|nr:amino acid adenylation domain-containing protein [bacterium]